MASDGAEALAKRLLEFIRAAAPLEDEKAGGFQQRGDTVLRTNLKLQEHMVETYRDCLTMLDTNEQRAALDQVIRALSGAIRALGVARPPKEAEGHVTIVTALAVYEKIENIVRSSADPKDRKAMQSQATALIDRFKPDLPEKQLEILRRKLEAASASRHSTGEESTVFREALRRLTDEGT
jgi:hypothetical protein